MMTQPPSLIKFSWKWVMPTIVWIGFLLVDLYSGFIFKDLHLNFFWIPLYCWTLHRPDLTHPLILFTAGFLYDAFLFLPMGLHSLLFLCFYGIIFLQRQTLIRQSFLVLWGVFSLLMVIFNIIIFGCIGDFSVFHRVLGASLMEIAAYPLLVLCLSHVKACSMEPTP